MDEFTLCSKNEDVLKNCFDDEPKIYSCFKSSKTEGEITCQNVVRLSFRKNL